MSDFHEQAVAQLMRTGRVELRGRENGNLYVSNQWDGTYKVLEWYDNTDDEYESITNRDGALEEIHSWCANLEKILAL
jgi:hypothetical protein